MDFDPTEFLAMAMTEDQNEVYTAPDLPHPGPGVMQMHDTITVEGGLQMEQHMQIPVPTFGILDLHNEGNMVENGFDIDRFEQNSAHDEIERPMEITLSDPENTTTPQLSPAERSSPQLIKKIIPVSYDESRFRKEFFFGHYERVKIFRLHCTICDEHLGCAPRLTERQMRNHKLLNVAVCRRCFEFYGDINFPIEEGSEQYCCWCGQGGKLFCCSTCPKTVCKKCVIRNFGKPKVKEIEENDNWSCFVCKPSEIFPHRAILWGLQRFGKEKRQHAALLPKEVKLAQLSKDTSHCCCPESEELSLISLPHKKSLEKIPLCLIAVAYQKAVTNHLEQDSVLFKQLLQASSRDSSSAFNNNITQRFHQNVLQTTARPPVSPFGPPPLAPLGGQNNFHSSRSPQVFQMRFPQNRPILNHQRMIYNSTTKRPAPYPVNRQMIPVSQPSHSLGPSRDVRHTSFSPLPLWKNLSLPNQQKLNPSPLISTEVIDLVEDDSPRQSTSKTHDISWLEKNIRSLKGCLAPITMQIDQFDLINGDLKEDFSKLTSYSERLSYNIKVGICNLAKINQDLLDAKKLALDNQVQSVVNNIQFNGLSSAVTLNHVTPPPNVVKIHESSKTTAVNIVHHKTPEPVVSEQPAETTPVSSNEEDMGDLSAALLCEAVLQVEGNKENEHGNKAVSNNSSPINTLKKKRGRPFSKIKSRTSLLQDQTSKTKIQVVNLIDDENTFDSSYYCKKFQIKPCRVVLKRCKDEVEQGSAK